MAPAEFAEETRRVLVGDFCRYFLRVEAALQQRRCFSHALLGQPFIGSAAEFVGEAALQCSHLKAHQPGEGLYTKTGLRRHPPEIGLSQSMCAHIPNTIQSGHFCQRIEKYFQMKEGLRCGLGLRG